MTTIPDGAFLVFLLQLPLRLAPRMNELAPRGASPAMMRKKKQIQAELDSLIFVARTRHPDWSARFETKGVIRKTKKGPRPGVMRVGGRRRLVRVTRHSARRPDELSVDVIGGKLPIDRLVAAGILVNDNHGWLERLADWRPAHGEAQRVIVEVFELPPPPP